MMDGGHKKNPFFPGLIGSDLENNGERLYDEYASHYGKKYLTEERRYQLVVIPVKPAE